MLNRCLKSLSLSSLLSSLCTWFLGRLSASNGKTVAPGLHTVYFSSCNGKRPTIWAKIPRLGSDLPGLGHVPIPEPNLLPETWVIYLKLKNRAQPPPFQPSPRPAPNRRGRDRLPKGKGCYTERKISVFASYYSQGFCGSCTTI